MKNLLKNNLAQFVGLVRNQPLLLAVLFAGVFGPLLGFGAIAEDVWQREGLRFDEPILRFIHTYATPPRDALIVFLTRLGSAWVMLSLSALITLVLWRGRRLREAKLIVLSVGGAALLNLLVKAFFGRERPHLWNSPAPESDFGFPSGHAMVTMAFAATLILLVWPTRWRWPALLVGSAFVLTIGLTRLYLGVHFPSDIVAGWCASLAWLTGVDLILRARQFSPDGEPVGLWEGLQNVRRRFKREFKTLQLVLRDERTPRLPKVLLSLAIGYALMPFDLIPDFIPIIGHLDDAIIIPALVAIALKMVPAEVVAECRAKASEAQEEVSREKP